MRRADAPPAGWYPDPENRNRLRWWDGLDWTDIRRAVPSSAELVAAAASPTLTHAQHEMAQPQQHSGINRAEAQQLIAEVRNVARAEVDRAAEQFSQRAENAIRSVTPLVSEYTSKLVRWIKFAAIVATVLLVGWFVFQVIFQASLFEWIGDRIDNLTNRDGSSQPAAALVALLDSR